MTAWTACATCGHLAAGRYCQAHTLARRQRTSDAVAWLALARRLLQDAGCCAACGRRSHLQATLTPRAWARRTAGLPIRAADAQVLCDPCAAHAGNPRPGTRRYAAWHDADGDREGTRPDPTIHHHEGN